MVKERRNLCRETHGHKIEEGRGQTHGNQCIAITETQLLALIGRKETSEQRLNALRNAVINRNHDKDDVGKNTVGRDARIARKSQDDNIKHNHYNAVGNLADQRRKPQREHASQFRKTEAPFDRIKTALFPD